MAEIEVQEVSHYFRMLGKVDDDSIAKKSVKTKKAAPVRAAISSVIQVAERSSPEKVPFRNPTQSVGTGAGPTILLERQLRPLLTGKGMADQGRRKAPLDSFVFNRATGKLHVAGDDFTCSCIVRISSRNAVRVDRVPDGATRCSYCNP